MVLFSLSPATVYNIDNIESQITPCERIRRNNICQDVRYEALETLDMFFDYWMQLG